MNDFILNPGYIFLPAEETRLLAVVSSGVMVTLYDPVTRRGGACYYVHPIRANGKSTPNYAAPSIVGLTRLFKELDIPLARMEAHLYGGASNPEAPRYVEGIAEKNVSTAIEILQKIGIKITSQDVGGNRGRKVAFHSITGETVVAKVERIRATDWYPQ